MFYLMLKDFLIIKLLKEIPSSILEMNGICGNKHVDIFLNKITLLILIISKMCLQIHY